MDFALVHGAYHGAWCWELLVPELVDRGHSAVAIDLPISDPNAGTDDYARTAMEVISGLERPVLVGHSMGGLVIPLIAAARPVSLMVFLAGFLPEPGASLAEQRSREPLDPQVDLSPPEFTHVGEGVYEIGERTAREMFYHDLSPGITDRAIRRLRPQSYRFMDEITPLRAWPECRSEYVVCADDHAINPAWGRRVAADRLGVEPHVVEGSHSPFLTRPAEVADILHAMTG